MSNPVRKGAMAEARIRTDPAMAVACDDLAWLSAHGALGGVAEIIRERRYQIEKLGIIPEHDDQHENGWLLAAAGSKLVRLMTDMLAGVAGYPETEEALRQSGALGAAEIDRLARLLTPEPESPDGG